MELPNNETLKIINDRKNYLLKKSEKNPIKNSYELQEIKALERVINLLTLYNNSFPYDLKKEIMEKDFNEKNNENESDDKNDYNILYSYEQEITKNSKLDVTFIRMKDSLKIYVILALKIYKDKLLKWVYQGKIKITPVILKKIFYKLKEIDAA